MDEPRPADPERLIIAPRLDGVDGVPRFLFVRWPDWPPPAMLSVLATDEAAAALEAVDGTLRARMNVECVSPLIMAAARVPVRMAHPRMGGEGAGWLRAVSVRVAGAPEPDALIDEVVALTLDEAIEQLTTDVERRLMREAAALFDD